MEVEEEGKDGDSANDEDEENDRCMDRQRDKRDVEGQVIDNLSFQLDDPGLWPAKITDQGREAIVRTLANRDGDVLMPHDSEAKPIPEFLLYH